MEIIDPDLLIPGKNIIENNIRNHPLNPNLSEHIDIVLVKEIIVNPQKEQSVCI